MATCEKCGKEHDGSLGSGRFCSRSCASSHVISTEQKEKVSASLKGQPSRIKDKEAWRKNLSAAHQRRRGERDQKILTEIPFEELNWGEKRKRLVFEQNGGCSICNIKPVWNGQPLLLEIDHIDGNNKNNSRKNLRAICPNCHSQTPTFRRKNTAKTVSDEEFVEALKQSDSIYKAIVFLEIRGNGGTYRRARKLINLFGLRNLPEN